jgi:hypothetical protein
MHDQTFEAIAQKLHPPEFIQTGDCIDSEAEGIFYSICRPEGGTNRDHLLRALSSQSIKLHINAMSV